MNALVSHLSVTSPSQVTLITLFACAAVAAEPRARLATGIAASTRLSSFASHPALESVPPPLVSDGALRGRLVVPLHHYH